MSIGFVFHICECSTFSCANDYEYRADCHCEGAKARIGLMSQRTKIYL